MLASMRLCANVPAQHAIQTALGGYQSISEFILPGGRLYEQRNRAWELINDIPRRFLRKTARRVVHVPQDRR
ncbi:aminotransferase [Salmonella enterica subsp. enterica]|uniref:Aminotransferase n=1 Tax=Salmonella enterica I TaxID=59201 RepID=A0A447TZ41_SALET|nr:aminotransferase [Salmonella enterica subsp. enterica]